jgi:hypothetical protein
VKLSGLLAVGSVALILVAASDARRIVGTRGPDLLFGTTRADRIVARGGTDRIDVAGGSRDVVSCGPGADLVAADPADRPGRDCERVVRRISTDLRRDGTAQHATQAEPDSFAWGTRVVATFQVGRYTDGGAQNIGFAVSSDAGRTWRSGLLPSLTVYSRPAGRFVRASDPVVAYDDVRGLWLISTLGIGANDTAILVSSSSDGLHWNAPVTAVRKPNGPDNGIQLDKEWIACDNAVASPWHGRCYVSYSDIETLRLVTQRSSDGGQTWSAPVGSPDNAGRRGIRGPAAPGPQPVVLPNGTLVIPINDDEIAAVRSTDGGASFSPAIRVAPLSFGPSPGLRAAALPVAEVGADGTIVLAWPDCRFRAGCGANDIVISRSRDGLSWTPPAAVPLGAGNHVIPGLAADRSRPGRLALAYYTDSARRLAVGFVSSIDGGATWTRPARLSPERMSFNRIARAGGVMVGDYISTSFAGGRAVPVFTLAQSPRGGLFRQATYASSIRVG